MNFILQSLQINNIVDIIIIFLSIYLVLIFIKQTRSFFVLGAFIALFVLNFISEKFDLGLTRQLFQPLLTFFIAVFVIVFQPEIRKFFKWISSGRLTSFKQSMSLPRNNIQTIVRAVFEMAKNKVGAIIVLPGEYPLDDLLEGGFPLNGQITAAVIQSIFDSSSPGHDGAVLIDGGEIKTFGLHLPLAHQFTDYRRVGTRHRAAAGITERTDAMAIVVSEERGEVSISSKGMLTKIKTPEELEVIISKFIGEDSKPKNIKSGIIHKIFRKNIILKTISALSAITLWFLFIYNAGIVKINYSIPIEYKSVSQDVTIKTSIPESIDITLTGNKRDVTSIDESNIKIVVDANNFKVGDNDIIIKKENIQIPSYIELTNFTPKNVKVKVINKVE